MKSKLIDSAVHRANDLACCAESVLVVRQQISKITVPQISCEAIGAGHFYKAVHTAVE